GSGSGLVSVDVVQGSPQDVTIDLRTPDGMGGLPEVHFAFAADDLYVIGITAGDGELEMHTEVSVAGGTEDSPAVPVDHNQAPQIDLGPGQTVPAGDAALLTARVYDDGLPTTGSLALNWSQVNGPGIVTFGTANAAQTTATFSLPGEYILKL